MTGVSDVCSSDLAVRPALPDSHAQALLAAVKVAVGGVVTYLDEVPDDPPYPYVEIRHDATDSSLHRSKQRLRMRVRQEVPGCRGNNRL